MKFAAKRTWPEKAATWEHQDTAADAATFASEFAKLEQLAVDTEFVVMCKDDDADQPAQYFRVAATNPYQLEPTAARSSTAAEKDEASSASADDAAPAGMPDLRPVISMVFFMGKVAFIATAGIALMAVGIGALRRFLE